MDKKTEALKLALEALKEVSYDQAYATEIAAIREALAEQPEQQEPVAWVCHGWSSDEKHTIDYEQHEIDAIPVGTLLYTTPPQRKPWVGLTDDDLRQIILVAIGVAEAKLKEKNA